MVMNETPLRLPPDMSWAQLLFSISGRLRTLYRSVVLGLPIQSCFGSWA